MELKIFCFEIRNLLIILWSFRAHPEYIHFKIEKSESDTLEESKNGDGGELADLIFGVYPWVGPLEAIKSKNFKSTTYHRFSNVQL